MTVCVCGGGGCGPVDAPACPPRQPPRCSDCSPRTLTLTSKMDARRVCVPQVQLLVSTQAALTGGK